MNALEKFQYISCCSLSNYLPDGLLVIIVSIHLMLQFILCQNIIQTQLLCFNTSHVVVYLLLLMTTRLFYFGFNTSHVVVYHKKIYIKQLNYAMFQYISCCSLSLFFFKKVIDFYVSIHLMLQFIYRYRKDSRYRIGVSIHLMLQFIHHRSHHQYLLIMFQYISCCSLSTY